MYLYDGNVYRKFRDRTVRRALTGAYFRPIPGTEINATFLKSVVGCGFVIEWGQKGVGERHAEVVLRRRREGRGRKKKRKGRGNGVRGEAPAKFFKSAFYPLSRPRWRLSFAFLSSSHRGLPAGEVWAALGAGRWVHRLTSTFPESRL